MRKFKVVEMGKVWQPGDDILHLGMVFTIEKLREDMSDPCPEDFDGTLEELNAYFCEEVEGNWYIVWEEVE